MSDRVFFETTCKTCISKNYFWAIHSLTSVVMNDLRSIFIVCTVISRCFCCFCIVSVWRQKRLVSLPLLCKRSMVRCCHRARTLSALHRISCTRHCITGSHLLMSLSLWYLFYGILSSQLFVFFATWFNAWIFYWGFGIVKFFIASCIRFLFQVWCLMREFFRFWYR